MLKDKTKKILLISIGIFGLLILYALKNTGIIVRVFGFFLSIFIFFMGDTLFDFKFKKQHYIIFILIAASGILFSPLYHLSQTYDKILHLLGPIFICILIFYLLKRLKISFSINLAITFFIAVSILALFEIFEYILDIIFNWKLQGVYLRDYSGIEKLNIIMDKNEDTMMDLILGTLGSLFFIAVKTGTFYFKKYRRKVFKKRRGPYL